MRDNQYLELYCIIQTSQVQTLTCQRGLAEAPSKRKKGRLQCRQHRFKRSPREPQYAIHRGPLNSGQYVHVLDLWRNYNFAAYIFSIHASTASQMSA